jgi:putative colanic acid biosynthesis acetyltransferase WcaF
MKQTDLSSFSNVHYKPGAPVKRAVWYLLSAVVFQSYLFPLSPLKAFLLRIFGAKVGKGLVIKPAVRIKYPWFLEIGDHVWIGESVWIDNLATVQLGNHVCLSQGAMLLTGNHDYSKPTFDLRTGSITIGDGAWIGARAMVCPGLQVESHAVLTAGAVAYSDLKAWGVYSGVPAVKVRNRSIE